MLKKYLITCLVITLWFMTAFVASIAVAETRVTSGHDYHYTGTLNINAGTGHIDADWLITVFDPDETGITFFLRDTLTDIEVTGPGVVGADTEIQAGPDGFWTVAVRLQNLPDDAVNTDRQIAVSYNGVLIPEPMENRINAIEPGRVELNVDSFWFPIDSRFSKFFSADLEVRIGEGWQGVTTGEALPVEGGFRIVNTDPRIDIAFTLSKSFHITQSEGFTIYDQRQQHGGTGRLVATAGKCRKFLDSRFGVSDPLPVSKLLITERESSGYARENYIVFTDISETKPGPLMRFVCHEFAHYWSRGAQFDTVDNWINEAFAEYLGMMAVREHLGQAAFDEMLTSFTRQLADKDLPRIWKRGDTERTSYLVQYRKGPLVLARLENSIGEDRFLVFLQQYFKLSEKSTEALIRVLADVAGVDSATLFESQLGE